MERLSQKTNQKDIKHTRVFVTVSQNVNGEHEIRQNLDHY